MIAGGCVPADGLSGAVYADAAGQGAGLLEVVKADLDRDVAALWFHRHLVAESALQLVGGGTESCLFLGPEDSLSGSPFSWLASQLSSVLGLAHRPARLGSVAGEAAADVVALGQQ